MSLAADLRFDLTQFSLEELMHVEITTVAKKEKPLFESPAAVYVITREDIRRAGFTSIPEALRLAPGLQMGRLDANKWAITARGFNGRFANKLLVLIDGRIVYTSLFSGVFWEVQDLLLEDVEPIEVIRGPGTTLWGANAVNGVINITTSMQEGDWARLERLRRGNEESWRAVQARGPRTLDDRAWTRYLAGDFPEYPEQILQANYSEVCRRLDVVMHDEEDLSQVNEHHWKERNPVVTEALVHLTTGGPQTVYWGGLAQGRVRYFDLEKKRPGLTEDTAALVTGLEADRVDLTLVNLNPGQRRPLLIGAGSFGEHQFDTVEVVGEQGCVEVSGAYLQVDLRPGSQIDLRLKMKRFCNKPSYGFPF